MHGEHGPLLIEDDEHADRSTAHEDYARDKFAVGVGDVGLELDEADLGRSKHIHRLQVHRFDDKLLAVHRCQPILKLSARGDFGNVDTRFGRDGDNAACCLIHSDLLLL